MPSFKIVKVLAIYRHGGHLGHMTETICFINSCPSFRRSLRIKFGFDMKSFIKEKCLKIMVIYMHLAPGRQPSEVIISKI